MQKCEFAFMLCKKIANILCKIRAISCIPTAVFVPETYHFLYFVDILLSKCIIKVC